MNRDNPVVLGFCCHNPTFILFLYYSGFVRLAEGDLTITMGGLAKHRRHTTALELTASITPPLFIIRSIVQERKESKSEEICPTHYSITNSLIYRKCSLASQESESHLCSLIPHGQDTAVHCGVLSLQPHTEHFRNNSPGFTLESHSWFSSELASGLTKEQQEKTQICLTEEEICQISPSHST